MPNFLSGLRSLSFNSFSATSCHITLSNTGCPLLLYFLIFPYIWLCPWISLDHPYIWWIWWNSLNHPYIWWKWLKLRHVFGRVYFPGPRHAEPSSDTQITTGSELSFYDRVHRNQARQGTQQVVQWVNGRFVCRNSPGLW